MKWGTECDHSGSRSHSQRFRNSPGAGEFHLRDVWRNSCVKGIVLMVAGILPTDLSATTRSRASRMLCASASGKSERDRVSGKEGKSKGGQKESASGTCKWNVMQMKLKWVTKSRGSRSRRVDFYWRFREWRRGRALIKRRADESPSLRA